LSAVIAQSPTWRWRTWLSFGLLLAVVLLLYRDTAVEMVRTWSRSDTYAHAFLVPPIVLWLVWRRRHVLAGLTPSPQAWVLLAMAAAGLLWLLGELAAVNAAMQFALVAMIVLLLPAVAGLAVARELMFPLGFLFFAVPIGDFMTPYMISWTADATILALRWTGIPVYRDGMQFIIPSGSWSVVEACSGVRYLMASLVVGTLFAYLNYRSTKRRLVFVGVSILVPIVANWLRAYIIVMLGHLSDNRIATGVDHLVYGWVFFGIVILLMFMIGARWSEPEASQLALPAAPARADGVAAGAAAPAWALLAGAALVIVWPHLAASALSHAGNDRPVQLALPSALPGAWQAAPAPLTEWAPGLANPSAAVQRSYVRDGKQAGMYIGYFRQQGPQRKLVSSSHSLAGPSKDSPWTQVSSGTRSLPLAGETLSVATAGLRGSRAPGHSDAERLLVWRLYWVNGQFTASDSHAKVLGAASRLLGRGDDAAVLLFYTPYDEDDAATAQVTLDGFVREQLAPMQALLQATRDAR
jgi:exosortase A